MYTFPEYNWTFKHAIYSAFKKGNLKCYYERRVFGVGYLGEGEYNSYENGEIAKCYKVWNSMLQRCYDSKYKRREPTYKE